MVISLEKLILSLLFQNSDQPLQSFDEPEIDKVDVFVGLVVLVGEPQEKGKRVYFELSFPYRLSCILPFAAKIDENAHDQSFGVVVEVAWPELSILLESLECVGVTINHNELGLGVEEPFGQTLHVGAGSIHADVWQELIGGVTQPHCLDVAGYDIGGFVALGEIIMLHRCFQCIGECRLEYIEHLLVHIVTEGVDVGFNALNRIVDGGLRAEGHQQEQQDGEAYIYHKIRIQVRGQAYSRDRVDDGQILEIIQKASKACVCVISGRRQQQGRCMIKIKSDINPKLLKNFSNQSFPDITILTATSKYSLTLAYLVIDSEYFNSLAVDVSEVNLSHLPEKQLVQILRALYGDQLIVYSVSELELTYRVIEELGIEEYKNAIVHEILNNKDLSENLEVLEFCHKHNLIVNQIKKIHIESNLRALESNKNFLQLNKISLQTLKPLLLEYFGKVEDQGASIINNILENYFNRNNIRPLDFFEKHDDVDVLLNIWEQFHHILHIERRPTLGKTIPFGNFNKEENLKETMKKSMIQNKPKSEVEIQMLKQKDAKIAHLQSQIQEQNRTIQKLRKQLFVLKSQSGKISSKRIPSNPILPLEDEQQISIIEPSKINKKDLVLKNVKSDFASGQGVTAYQSVQRGMEIKTPGRIVAGQKPSFLDY